ncbi:hypothetical protein OO012_03740 [Rhodobacteraceae bacterium KMM 6894]|nr:hypothetical protein [Rhodobacteraceae bacterium KMM 6894]
MKRRLLNFYRRRVPLWVKRLVPESAIGLGAGVLNRVHPHPDLVFQHARYLVRRGRAVRAGAIYHRGKGIEPGQALIDPLFHCTMEPATPEEESPRVATLKTAQFHLEFSYSGLKVLALSETPADALMIEVDGIALRRSHLTYRDGRAEFHYTIKRDTLAHFPRKSRLRLRFSDGRLLQSRELGAEVCLNIPHGDGTLAEQVATCGQLDKKGNLPPAPDELAEKHLAYLQLYERANVVFRRIWGAPLILMCGTLLGQHRDHGFIPGDDDFDAGYVSDALTGAGVKADAIDRIEKLVHAGLTVVVNREGKPFRIAAPETGPTLHIDVTPIFSDGQGHVLLHKMACLPLELDGLRESVKADMCGMSVEKPRDTTPFLAAYYGKDWGTPNPCFTYSNHKLPRSAAQLLNETCLTLAEQRALAERLEAEGLGDRFLPLSLQPLYPLPSEAEPVI